MKSSLFLFLLYLLFTCFSCHGHRVGEINITAYREKARQMFYHAYNGYLNHAYPYDELQPLTCKGHDTWGSYSLTLIDAMDTLVVMGNHSEFRRIAQLLIDKGEGFFDTDINASVFETNIRIVGGLLSAHLLMSKAEMVLEPAWPCSGPLLRMAENVARKILPAFDTPTGMPYGTVNLRHGVPKGETTVTCTAGVGTFLLEFGALSRLTGDPIFEKTAVRAIRALWKFRSPLGLLGNHIDVSTGKWTAMDSGIGGGVDSYFEYLVKGAIMFNVPEFLHMFREYETSIKRYLKRDDWYMWAHMTKGTISLPLFTSLDGYWPSIQGMLGDIDEAMKTLHNYHQVWRQFGFTPEYYNIPNADVHNGREGYPLRPEIIESAMYLYRATKDPYLLEIGVDILEGIEQGARTSCGYATVKDVRDHRLEDRMESFFLAETAKYLYLLFDPDNFLHETGSRGEIRRTPGGLCVLGAGGFVFNTEAHPLDLSAVHCCSAEKREDDRRLQDMEASIDLLATLGLKDRKSDGHNDGFWEEFKHGSSQDNEWKLREWKLKDRASKHEQEKYFDGQGEQSCRPGASGSCEKEVQSSGTNDDSVAEVEDGDFYDEFEEIGGEEDEEDYEEEAVHQRQTNLVDMTKFTEMERNFTRAFMEELQLKNLLKNLSTEVAHKMRLNFKETQHELMANNVARKLDAASLPEEGQVGAANKSETASESKATEKSSKDFRSDLIIEGVNDDDSDDDVHDKIENRQGEPEPDKIEKAQQGEAKVVHLKISAVPERSFKIDESTDFSPQPSPVKTEESELSQHNSNGKFKQHIQQQLQKDDEQQKNEQNALDEMSSKSPSPLDKRTNLLSITTKLLQMFSGDSKTSKDGDNSKAGSPSLAGLHAALSNYSLNYFNDPWVMHCPSRPFYHRLSIYGEMFPDET
ncbi:hypothetical protein EGW08_010256 [Elysia chlorotica]|uniref:alpha-1,2-Mannosidase n=1 Tax=Elysia chlorotica TaxID=188477 RepID=A0A3S1BE95_ELYCH|nr:hypothetical protein EGW08_010256 [Elysia chlorotica]